MRFNRHASSSLHRRKNLESGEMDALPRALVREILACASAPELVPASLDALDGRDFAKVPAEPSTSELRVLAQVCRTWRELVEDVCAENSRRVLHVDVVASEEERQQQQCEQQLREAGKSVRDLRVSMSRPKQALWWDLDHSADPTASSLSDNAALASIHWHWIDWPALLALCPNVERLDLSGVPLHYAALGDIIDAAANSYPHLQALVLPKRDFANAELVDASIDELFQKLYAAMRCWKSLRQLTVPSRSVFDREDASNEFLASVLKFCPSIEYLDGWKRTYGDTRFIMSEENLCVSREVWTAFCRACERLREFSWVVVPFSDEFFIPFGKSSNALLTRLQLTYNAKAPFRIRRNEYSTQGLCMLVRGCPALEQMDVVLHRLQPSDALIYPQLDEMIDPDVFNDEFIVTLVRSCSLLRTLRIREVGTCALPMNAITDRGLRELASARHLQLIDLQGVKCSPAGILSFFHSFFDEENARLSNSSHFRHSLAKRVVNLRELGARFGDVVQVVLGDLGTSKEFVFNDAPVEADDNGGSASAMGHPAMLFSLSLASRRGSVVRKSWLAEMRSLLESRFDGKLRFAVFIADRRTRGARDPVAKTVVMNRSWMKKDVLRVGKIVFFSSPAALSRRDRQALGAKGETWIVDRES